MLWDGGLGWCQGIIVAFILKNPNPVLAKFGAMYSAWVNREQPAMSDNHNNKHVNLEGVSSMWHSSILTAYMQQFWSNLCIVLWEQWLYSHSVRKYLG